MLVEVEHDNIVHQRPLSYLNLKSAFTGSTIALQFAAWIHIFPHWTKLQLNAFFMFHGRSLFLVWVFNVDALARPFRRSGWLFIESRTGLRKTEFHTLK